MKKSNQIDRKTLSRKRLARRLQLNRKTLRNLTVEDLGRVRGGGRGDDLPSMRTAC